MQKNVLLLIEKAERFLTDAEELVKIQGYASAVSRAYYAMFHCSQALLLSIGEIAHTHKGVVTLFNKHFILTKVFDKRLGKMFSKIQYERERADYEIGFKANKEYTIDILKDAQEFVIETKNYLKYP